MNADFIVVGENGVLFFLCGVVNVGCIVEILTLYVVVSNISTISSFTKCDGVWISCGVKIVALCY